MMRKPLYSQDQSALAGGQKFGMMAGCQESAQRVVWSMHTPSPAFVPAPQCRDCSVIRTRGWSPWFDGEENDLRRMWHGSPGLVRPYRRRVRDLPCGPYRIYLDLEVRRVDCRRCGKVKRERLEFLLENALHTERFARYVGRRCRTGTIKAIATEMNLDWQTVKRLEMRFMRMQLERAPKPNPQALGIDEISIRKGHVYRIVVSDLHRQRPIWFGGEDRSEQSMDEFYRILGEKKARRVRLAVMDMWKPFCNSTTRHAPQAAILFDKFHVLRHLDDALDKVRKQEYARLSGKGRAFIKGQKYGPAPL